jgi:hypothetical protein
MNVNRLSSMLGLLPAAPGYEDYAVTIIPYVLDDWMAEYRSKAPKNEIVEVDCGGFRYLFDVIGERLIAAWGVSMGKHSEPRPAARMKGHPLSNGPLYHRGHAIPHTLGGGTDINLVPQLGSINVGDFRELEKRAVATPGALYFSHWLYTSGTSQTPVSVEQGFLCPGHRVDIRSHRN